MAVAARASRSNRSVQKLNYISKLDTSSTPLTLPALLPSPPTTKMSDRPFNIFNPRLRPESFRPSTAPAVPTAVTVPSPLAVLSPPPVDDRPFNVFHPRLRPDLNNSLVASPPTPAVASPAVASPAAATQPVAPVLTQVNKSTFVDNFGMQTITILVGVIKQKFVIHKTLLLTRIPHFCTLLANPDQETTTLPQEKPQTFNILLKWLYSPTPFLPPLNLRIGSDGMALKADFDVVALYLLASRLQITELMDLSLSAFIEGLRLFHLVFYPSPSVIGQLFSSVPSGSNFQVFLAQLVAHMMDDPTSTASWSREEIKTLLASNKELARAVESVTRKRNSMKRDLEMENNYRWMSLFDLPTCYFHIHEQEEGETCLYEPKEVEDSNREVERLRKANAGLKATLEMERRNLKGRKKIVRVGRAGDIFFPDR